MMPVFFICIIILCIWIKYEISKNKHTILNDTKSFLELEHQANLTKKFDLDKLEYIVVPDDILIIATNDNKIHEMIDYIKLISSKRIYNLSGFTSTEISLKFGKANLETLSSFDDNYTELIKTLYALGEYLYNNCYVENAIKILEYAIKIKTDISKNYILLAKIYIANNECKKIDDLIITANSLNTMIKSSIINELNNLKTSAIILSE